MEWYCGEIVLCDELCVHNAFARIIERSPEDKGNRDTAAASLECP